MITIKGFVANTDMTSNVKDAVNPIGELSAYSVTYAKDRGVYSLDNIDALVLTTFTTKNEGEHFILNLNQYTHILEVSKWVYQRSISKGTEIYAHELLLDLIDQFSGKADHFKSGEIVYDGNIWMPEWISWKMVAETETYIRIWFADDSFRRTYDEYELTVVPALPNVDDFFKTSTKVKKLLDERTLPIRTNEIEVAKDGKPETKIRTELFHYVDPLDKTNKIPTYWDVLIYGEAGDNIDSIKDAIIEYILSHTTRTREEWTEIFPDIFKRTEFILLPDWNQYAIPNRQVEAGIYSPILNVSGIIPELTRFTSLVEEGHRNRHTEVMSHPYKSMLISSVSSQENRDNKFSLKDFFPDYIAQSSTSQDFNRQNDTTRLWSEKLTEMIILAEEMTKTSDIPRRYTRLIRGDILYLVMNYENVHYLVVAKWNYEDHSEEGQ